MRWGLLLSILLIVILIPTVSAQTCGDGELNAGEGCDSTDQQRSNVQCWAAANNIDLTDTSFGCNLLTCNPNEAGNTAINDSCTIEQCKDAGFKDISTACKVDTCECLEYTPGTAPAPPTCGDGTLDGDFIPGRGWVGAEQCDASTQAEANDQCASYKDDGFFFAGCDTDTCRCDTPAGGVCGDGIVDLGEGCDDGIWNSPWGQCDWWCSPTTCGDGIIQTPNGSGAGFFGAGQMEQCEADFDCAIDEVCDLPQFFIFGAAIGGTCQCVPDTFCGDGTVQTPNDQGTNEQCEANADCPDIPNTVKWCDWGCGCNYAVNVPPWNWPQIPKGGIGIPEFPIPTVCGDDIWGPGEQCDPTAGINDEVMCGDGKTCNSDCTCSDRPITTRCGDGIVSPSAGEECDLGGSRYARTDPNTGLPEITPDTCAPPTSCNPNSCECVYTDYFDWFQALIPKYNEFVTSGGLEEIDTELVALDLVGTFGNETIKINLKNDHTGQDLGIDIIGLKLEDGLIVDSLRGGLPNPTMTVDTQTSALQSIFNSPDRIAAALEALSNGAIRYESANPAINLVFVAGNLLNRAARILYIIPPAVPSVPNGRTIPYNYGGNDGTLHRNGNGIRLFTPEGQNYGPVLNQYGTITAHTTTTVTTRVTRVVMGNFVRVTTTTTTTTVTRYSYQAGVYQQPPNYYANQARQATQYQQPSFTGGYGSSLGLGSSNGAIFSDGFESGNTSAWSAGLN